jgi:carnitine O-acetyltransferase
MRHIFLTDALYSRLFLYRDAVSTHLARRFLASSAAASPSNPPAKTFSNQSKLPRLPIPSLGSSVGRYLQSLKPILTPEQWGQSKKAADEFLTPGGVGEKLQQRLVDYDKQQPVRQPNIFTAYFN